MFLNESYNTAFTYNEKSNIIDISADPICGYQICLEAEQSWHKMEMQMIKLEHAAIINNDEKLLSEGEEGWWDKTKKWFQALGKTFLSYIDKVIEKWQEIQMKIKSRMMNIDKMFENITNNKELRFKKMNINIQVIRFGSRIADAGNKIVDNIRKMADNSGINKKHSAENVLANFWKSVGVPMPLSHAPAALNVASYKHNGTTNALSPITDRVHKGDITNVTYYLPHGTGEQPVENAWGSSEIKETLVFLKDKRAKAIDILKKARNEGAKLINRGIKSASTKSEDDVKAVKEQVNIFKGVMNSFIVSINKASVQALKVLSIASEKNISSKQFDAKIEKASESASVFESSVPYNILDSF